MKLRLGNTKKMLQMEFVNPKQFDSTPENHIITIHLFKIISNIVDWNHTSLL